MSKISGDLIFVIINGYTLMGQKTGGMDVSADTLESTSKDSNKWREYIYGWKTTDFTVDDLYDPAASVGTGFADFFGYIAAETVVTVKFGEIVAGKTYWTSSALISKVNLSGPSNQVASYTLTLKGTGVPTQSVVGASSSNAEITEFSFPSLTKVNAVITTGGPTVAMSVTTGTTKTALVADFKLSPGAVVRVGGVIQISGLTPNDFTASVNYLVTAQDGTQKTWAVSVGATL